MLDNNYIKNGLNGIFLMFVVMFGEYIEKLFPCGFQKLFIRNIYCKYIMKNTTLTTRNGSQFYYSPKLSARCVLNLFLNQIRRL